MIRAFLCTFIIMIFALSSFAKIQESLHVDEHISTSIESVGEADDCEDDCSDCSGGSCTDSGVCSNSCLCLTSFHISPIKSSFKSEFVSSNKLAWYLIHKYKSPILDPALKPPLFS